jgi:magnesium transporter
MTYADANGPNAGTYVRILARPSTSDDASREIAVEALEHVIADREVTWIDLVHPDTAANPVLSDSLRLGPLTVEDCLLPVRMPKLDPFSGEGAFVAAFAVRLEEEHAPRLRSVALALVIGPAYLVTVRRDPLPEVSTSLKAALSRARPVAEESGVGLAHTALNTIVEHHLPVMLRAAEVAEELEEQLDLRSHRESLVALEHLIVLRRDLLAFRRLGVAQQEVLRRLGRLFPGVRAHLADVADDEREAMDTAAAICDYIDGAIEAYRMRRTIRTEDGIQRLTVLAGIFAPLSLIIGLWGINFLNIPGTQVAWGWPIFVAVLCGLGLLGALYFRRRGLL